jgi:hypothetical protein
MRISIDEILRSGRFAGLKLGDSKAQMEELYGTTDAVSRPEESRTYRYDDVEVHVAHDRVWFIALRFRRTPLAVEPPLGLDGAVAWTCEATEDEVRTALDRAGISTRVDARFTYEDQVVLICEPTQARVAFSDGFLDKIYLTEL